ncbi:inner membrane protein YbjM [Erwinia persicina]|uniref:inner membrane protein YbjM n=1 Tax=Erwinia persicina TaxID=55211 RepID=UPI000E9FB079|nr:inner membrane protein YbjM [Erwinia persicina]MBD8166357.1 hypothetical protein [Erwinia persicina]MCQ4092991.1 inner membrane protein YbjM [Erwinia persicina]MCQ4100402.1 inner membrane protein YbjM [Erwinia persicina]MCQ4106709.1 inner membrane protein YbjM [Erwinia persicina]QZQ48972.1 inner membrane protein YbjM [Erwinia persicina]
MWIKGIRWTGLIACSALYGAIYIAVRYPLPAGYSGHAQLGLLLFVLPGALAALTSREAPLTVMTVAIALASPPCLLLMQSDGFNSVGLGQEIAFIASAVFWCGSGTLAVMLWRTLMEMHQQQQDRKERL